MNKTIDFYDENASDFFESTKNGNMELQYNDFLVGIPKDGYILDLGCGSGRDSKYFLSKGYRVLSVDGSKELVSLATKFTQQEVKLMDFSEVHFENTFSGIWACASLLHIPKSELITVMVNLCDSLIKNGKMYISLKEGIGSSIENGRFYQYYTDEEFQQIISGIKGLRLVKSYPTTSVTNPNEQRKWNNYFLKKE